MLQEIGFTKEDKEVEFTILLATQTAKKKKKLIMKLPVKIGEFLVKVPALVLEGLHFNVLLGMSWINAVQAVVNSQKKCIEIRGKEFKYSGWPEPSLFTLNGACKVYLKEFFEIEKGC